MCDCPIKLVGGVREQLDPVLDQFGGDCVERDAGFLELGQDMPRILDIFLEAVARLAMIAKGVKRGRRHRVDGVGSDQLLDVEHVAVVLVFRSGRGPQQSLRFCPLCLERFPARSGEQALVFLIGEFGVGDRDLALQRGQPFFLGRIIGASDLFVELLVDRAVDAADEEAGDAGDVGGIAVGGDIFFQPRKIGFGDLHIDLLREQQRDVDADAFADQMLDRGQALRRRRHLDHQVLAADVLPQMLGLSDGTFGIHRQIGRDLQADEAVVALQLIIDRAQHVRRVLDVLDRKLLEQLGHRAIAFFESMSDRTVIFVRTADRLFEDRRIRRDALDAVAVDQLLQVAFGYEAAGQEIQPDRLAVVFECFDGIHDALFLFELVGFRVPAASGGTPNVVNTSLRGR